MLDYRNILGTLPIQILKNIDYKDIFENEEACNDIKITNNKVPIIYTGKFTGRSPKDKYYVHKGDSCKNINWNSTNNSLSIDRFDKIFINMIMHTMYNQQIYIFNGVCAKYSDHKLYVRFYIENIWQYHFVKNMFEESNENVTPDFHLLVNSSYKIDNYTDYGIISENIV